MAPSKKTATGPDPIDIQVGMQIRARRNSIGSSQSALAEAIGVSFQQVQKYERGANRVSASMMSRIAAHLGCRPADLLPSGDGGDAVPLDSEFLSQAGGPELAKAFMSLSPRLRRAIVDLALSMAAAQAPEGHS
ncbi:helix-turn-helix domain-containing protein [Phenylobacterium sp. LH3H17]|uniref:helix-turn-helix domain-containing protein n=1 Tax=Phenylobacterium sp. LH3H17 TaxID=2903901 RepID=UPI0020C9C9D7|nr:helix-turn-helix transcriptional regulator [Phenylobacterium sp. LH3H17]UTP40905.1 helix-turn-helix domain-containing protein [Phenylobacterium sp. LH3H17]